MFSKEASALKEMKVRVNGEPRHPSNLLTSRVRIVRLKQSSLLEVC